MKDGGDVPPPPRGGSGRKPGAPDEERPSAEAGPPPEPDPPAADAAPAELVELRDRLARRETRLLEARQRRIRSLGWAVVAALGVLLVVVWLTLLR